MTLQPITDEEGNVIDEYDDSKEALPPEVRETAPSATQAVSSEVEVTQQEREADEQVARASSQAQSPPPPVVRSEDVTDFEASDVSITITLQRADGHPQGRLVSVVIHNFSGSPLIADFREAELTDQVRLDSIHRAIYPVMQRFLLELSGRRQKKLEEEAKRAPRPAPLPAQKATPPSASTIATQTPQPAPTPKPQASPQTGQAVVSGKDGGKKKDTQSRKYQAIPMF